MKKKNLLMLSLLLSVAAAPDEALSSEVFYLTPTHNGCGSGSWFVGDCWFDRGPSVSRAPMDGDAATLASAIGGYVVTYDANARTSLDFLDVGGGTWLSIGGVPAGVANGSATLKITNSGARLEARIIAVGAGNISGGQATMVQETGGVSAGVGMAGLTGLKIGFYENERGSYILTGGTLATHYTFIGSSGSGTFTHDGATGSNVSHDAEILILGDEASGHGVYTLGAGRLTSTSQIVGNSGTGEFTQSAPLNSYNNTGSLTVGKNVTGVGTYTMQGGWLFAGSETIGREGTGTFTHWGGLNDVTGDLVIGAVVGSTGTYSMRGMFGGNPELRARDEFVGWAGTGSFDQYGGIHTVSNGLTLGVEGGSSGSYLLDGDGTLSTGFTVVGSSGDGVFTQHTGSHTVGGGLYIGDLSTGRGVYNLYGGSLSAASIVVGNEGTGWFTQTYGSNTAGDLVIGNGIRGSGTYTLDGWQNLDAGAITVGNRGVATFTQNYGTVNVGTSLVIGAGAGSAGTYHLNGGQLNAAHTTVGMDGTGVFNQTDGQNRYNYVPGTVTSLNVGTGSGSGTYNMSGGSVWKHNINLGTGTGSGTFNHTGGTVSADGTLTIGANGTYNMSAGGLWAPDLRAQTAIVNNGTVNFNSGRISAGFDCSYCGEGPFPTEILNNGTFNIGGAGERQLSGVTVNNGTMKITDTTVRFSRDFLNNGAYISDPSTNIFNGSLMVSETGYLAGGTGDSFQIWNDFFNYSTRADLWNTADATLSFRGWETHQFYLGGWDAASSRRFSWGTLELSGSGDLFFSGDFGAALYVDNLILGSGTTLNLNGFDLYYTTLTDNGGSFTGGRMIQVAGNPGGGAIPAVPEPSMLLLFGSGLAGLFGVRGFGRLRRGA